MPQPTDEEVADYLRLIDRRRGGSRTNFLRQSGAMITSPWVVRSGGVDGPLTNASSGFSDPLGGTNAVQVNLQGPQGNTALYQTFSPMPRFGAQLAGSVWIKPIVRGTGLIRVENASLGTLLFDVDPGPTNVWTRISGTYFANGTGAGMLITSADNSLWTVQLFGAQLELGPRATPYIPTTTTIVTAPF